MVFLQPTNLRLGKNHSGQDKAHMYVRDILIIKNFAIHALFPSSFDFKT